MKRIGSLLARRYLARVRRGGLDSSVLARLPEAAQLPLRRTGVDPVPELAAVREREPVHRLPVPFGLTVWLVTGHAATKTVLADTATFSNDFANLAGHAGTPDQNPGGLGFADPPEHTRLRKLLTPEFTKRRLARLTPGIDDIVASRLDAMAAAEGPVDLVAEFALPIPSLVICELLGVPYDDRAEFQRLSMARFDLFGGADASLGAISDSLSYLRSVVRAQRESPTDGLLGMIIKEHGDKIDDHELAGLADGVLTGGFETTASMLALGTLVLLRDPDAFAAMRGGGDAASALVEELLRYLTVVQVAFPRFARADTEIAGVRIGKGDMVVCSLSGADRDPALTATSPEEFRADRPATAHLAFGYGAHRCIGAELARMELRAAYPALVQRFPRLRLAVPPEQLRFRKASIVYGLESLPVLVD